MASAQHTYRRKHTYWYRRVLTLFSRCPVDVRLSLRTSDRREAQHRAATLTAATGEVLRMIEVELKAPDGRPTEAELRAMARRMYEVVLAETMDKQRETPELAAAHRASNRAHIDYFDHVVRTGGRSQVSAVDIQSFAALGWSAERLDRLELLANAYAVQPAIATRTIDALLREHGYRSAEPLRRIVERVLYPAYRKAVAEADRHWDEADEETASIAAPHGVAVASSPTAPPVPAVPIVAAMRIADARDACVADKLGMGEWREESVKQTRQSISLLLHVVGGTATIEGLTQADLGNFYDLLGKLPRTYGRTRAELAGGVAASLALAAELDSELVGLGLATRNRHLTAITGLLGWAAGRGHKPAVPIDFAALRASRKTLKRAKLKRNARPAWTEDEIGRLLAAPVWTGCDGLADRFIAGKQIYHDAWYWIPLMLVLHGARSSEFAGLSLEEIDVDDAIPNFTVRPTVARGLKNQQSERHIPIHPELLRLGLADYVRAMRAAGHTLLFPEMNSPAKKTSFASVFYKQIFCRLAALGVPRGHDMASPDQGVCKDKDVYSFRHTVASRLDDADANPASVSDLLGHANKTTSTTASVYVKAKSLAKLLPLHTLLPPFTEHLPRHPLNLRPPAWQRYGQRGLKLASRVTP